jgi:hypothetical protein
MDSLLPNDFSPAPSGLLLQTVVVVVGSYVVYWFARAIYRLYLSPIAHFPGPKLAAITWWYEPKANIFRVYLFPDFSRYEFYYDVIKNGQYTFKIGELHREYGPIIRINPFEIHIETPEFYEKVYAGSGKRRDRWDVFTKQFGIPDSIFATNDHETHRIRRAALNPFFSKASVRRLQPVLDERLDRLLGRFSGFQESGKPMILNHAFAAFTAGCSPSPNTFRTP